MDSMKFGWVVPIFVVSLWSLGDTEILERYPRSNSDDVFNPQPGPAPPLVVARWPQILVNPSQFDHSLILLKGYLKVEGQEEHVTEMTLYPSLDALENDEFESSCRINLDQKFLRNYHDGSLDEWKKLHGTYVKMRGVFDANPAFVDGEGPGRLRGPLLIEAVVPKVIVVDSN